MSFLLDTDICSAYLKGQGVVWNRFIQHTGGLHISSNVLGELYTWLFRARTSPKRLLSLNEMLTDVMVLDVTADVGKKFGEVRAGLLDRGLPAPDMDLFTAATALVHDLTLVTHNTQDFANVPDLRLADWLTP